MIKEVLWDGKTDLWEYDSGTILNNIPRDHSVFYPIWQYLAEKNRWLWPCWWRRTDRILDSFDELKFAPIYFCKMHRKVEDGTHRFIVAEILDIKYLSLLVGKLCFSMYGEKKILAFLHQTIDSIGSAKKSRDHSWLSACHEKKWPLFANDIDFAGRSVLDVGCNVGYTCYQAWKMDAAHILGIDIRTDVLHVAEALKSYVGATNIEFREADWRYHESDEYDVVFCMGLLHYFGVDVYKHLLAKLCAACKETLILELRILDSDRPFLSTRSQTVPTIAWLTAALREMGFESVERYALDKGGRIFAERGLWVSKRKQADV